MTKWKTTWSYWLKATADHLDGACPPSAELSQNYPCAHIILLSTLLCWLLSVCLGTPLWRSWSCWCRKPSRLFQFLLLILKHCPPSTLLHPQSMFPEALFLNGMARLSGCLHSIWWEPAWSRVLRGVVLWPLSRCWACQDLQALSVNMCVPGRARKGRTVGGGRLGGRAGRKDGKQAVGFWDHFALTHIPPFCSECLNMRTTQLLLTPAPPLKRSGDD